MSRSVTSTPFQRPQSNPTPSAASTAAGAGTPLVTRSRQRRPRLPVPLPTDRSTPLVAMTIVMPMARMATGRPRFSTSIRLPNRRRPASDREEAGEQQPVDEQDRGKRNECGRARSCVNGRDRGSGGWACGRRYCGRAAHARASCGAAGACPRWPARWHQRQCIAIKLGHHLAVAHDDDAVRIGHHLVEFRGNHEKRQPSSRSRLMVRTISAWAPTSMPRWVRQGSERLDLWPASGEDDLLLVPPGKQLDRMSWLAARISSASASGRPVRPDPRGSMP